MEGNGQSNNESRLDRLEAAYNLMIQDHEEFRREHKALLTAQVVMQDSLTRLSGKLERLSDKVEEIGDKLNGLIAYSEQTHRENEQTRRENEVRFRRLEEKH